MRDAPRGADCTENGVSFDISAKVQNDDWQFVAGHEEHGVTGFDRSDRVVFGAVAQSTFAGMRCQTVMGARLCGGYNFVSEDIRLSVQYAFGPFQLNAERTGRYVDASAVVRAFDFDEWAVDVRYDHSNGFEHLPDPFDGRADALAATELNAFSVLAVRKF